MTTVLNEAKRIRRQASKGYRHDQIQLLAAVTSSATVFGFATTIPNSLRTGAMLSIDLELMLVISVNVPANQATVVRGAQDSVAVAHSTNDIIDIGSRFTLLDIVDAMQSEIAGWSPALYYPASATSTIATNAMTYELPVAWAGMLGVIDVRQSDLGDDVTTWPRLGCTLVRGAVAEFTGAPTSGKLLRFHEPIRTGQLYVTVGLPYVAGVLTVTTDLETDLKLNEGLRDLLDMGVKRRLMLDEVQGRMARQAQDESRRAEETPIGSLVPLSQLNLMAYNRRLQEEVNRLGRTHALRFT